MKKRFVPCAARRCRINVPFGQGYCSEWHGGYGRLVREIKRAEEQARRLLGADGIKKLMTGTQPAPAPERRRHFEPWGPRGAPVGSGLLRCSIRDSLKRPE